MPIVKSLGPYRDDQRNVIDTTREHEGDVEINFKGSNNKVIVAYNAKIKSLRVTFDGDNGLLRIGKNPKVGKASFNIRIGQDSTVRIGDNVSTTNPAQISAVEGTTVSFGNDVMIASGNQFRADDAHPIFDVETELRVNPSADIKIGNHVWIAAGAAVLGGAEIGDGSVIGFRSLVTRKIPNNCVAVGAPAKVVRRNIAWERPHLSNTKPFYKPDASTVTKSEDYWNLTEVEEVSTPVVVPLTRSEKIKTRLAASLRRIADKLG